MAARTLLHMFKTFQNHMYAYWEVFYMCVLCDTFMTMSTSYKDLLAYTQFRISAKQRKKSETGCSKSLWLVLIVIECQTAQVFYTSHLKVATDPDRTGMEQHEKPQTYSNVGNMYREEAKADSQT